MAVAEQVLGLIDSDRDGAISTDEAAAYAELLRRDLVVRLDQRNVELKLVASHFPAPAELRTGLGIIKMEFSAVPGPLAAGSHRLTLENRHLPAVGEYLINAAKPRSGSVQITRQTRNENQSAGEIEFAFHPPASSSGPSGSSGPFGSFGSSGSSRRVGFVALLAVLLVVVIAGAWGLRKSSPRLAEETSSSGEPV